MDGHSAFIYEKPTVRRALLARRNSVADKPLLSRFATERIMPLLRGNVMCYVSIGSEVDTSRLIDVLIDNPNVTLFATYTADGVIYPLLVKKRGVADRYGNMPEDCYIFGSGLEEARAAKIDVCVTPLVGFDEKGYRIGYGKGCYDRFFAGRDVYKIGLAFDCQACEFSRDAHDIALDCCVTESKVIYF